MEEQRCDECGSIMCSYKYKHNGIDKVGYRCPSAHGLRKPNQKGLTVLEFVKLEELDEI